MNPEPAIAEAIARAVAASRVRRVPLRDLLVAAASVDRTAAASIGWRARVLSALTDLAGRGLLELPRTRLDRSADPPLPAYVTRPAAPRPAPGPPVPVVWHMDLSWAAGLELTPAERRFLAAVNDWLPRRRAVVVPLRERSLDIVGDEKELERRVLGPLFAPGRLSLAQLACHPCWPPVEQADLGPGEWLIIENYTTFVSVSRRARELDFTGRIVWGSGNQVATRLSTLAATVPHPPSCWYFGDLDAGGFRAAKLAVTRATELDLPPITPAHGLYALALTHGHPRPAPGSPAIANWTRTWLNGKVGAAAATLVSTNQRIIQEHVGLEILATTTLSDWFTSDDRVGPFGQT